MSGAEENVFTSRGIVIDTRYHIELKSVAYLTPSSHSFIPSIDLFSSTIKRQAMHGA